MFLKKLILIFSLFFVSFYIHARTSLSWIIESEDFEGAERLEMMKNLLEAGEDPNSLHFDQLLTPLHLVLINRNIESEIKVEMVKLLLKAGANPNAASKYNNTVLLDAVSARYISPAEKLEIVQILLKAGADPNIENSIKNTPLYVVREPETAELLLKNGADLNHKNRYNQTALAFMLHSDHTGNSNKIKNEIMKVFLKYGASGIHADDKELTSLSWAVTSKDVKSSERFKIVQTLLKTGADPNVQKGPIEYTPLHRIVLAKKDTMDHRKKMRIIKLLLEYGADPNILDSRDNHALLNTTNYKQIGNSEKIDIIEVLLEAGSDPNIQNELGNTALHVVKNFKVAKLLLEYGADPSIENEDGQNVLNYIVNSKYISSRDRSQVIKVLLNHAASDN